MVDGNPQTTSPMHCGLGSDVGRGRRGGRHDEQQLRLCRAGPRTAITSRPTPEQSDVLHLQQAANSATSSVNENTSTSIRSALEGTRGGLRLAGHRQPFRDRSSSATGCGTSTPATCPSGATLAATGSPVTRTTEVVGGIPTGSVTVPPTSGAITPTTTQFSTNYTTSSRPSAISWTLLTGATAGQSGLSWSRRRPRRRSPAAARAIRSATS